MPFTTNSPVAGGIPLPAGVTPVGGIVLDIIGINGVRVVSQLAASDLYVGYFSQNPGVIGTQSGFTQAAIDALGGGIAEGAVRFTIEDGDTAPFNFDDHENTLLINGIAFGDFSDVVTVVTDGLGNELGAPGTGFPNNQLATGFFHLTDTAALASLYQSLSGGTVTFALTDVDPGDNYFDFTQGIDGELVDVGQPPNVSPVIDTVLLPGSILEGSRFAVRVDAHDPDGTAGGLTYRFDIDGDGVFDVENTTGVARFTVADDLQGSVVVEVADARGGLTRRSIALDVENVAPVVALDAVPAVPPGGTAKLTGTITDPGTRDTFVIRVDWGDGTTQEMQLAASATGVQTFSLKHVYEAAAEGGAYPVSVTVVDDDGGKGVATTTIEVGESEPPSIVLDPLGLAKEGDAVLLSGLVSGMDGVERYRVEIDWGDGTVERVTVLGEDGGVFSASHKFVGDGDSSTRDAYPVTATVIAPGVRVRDAEIVTVRNVAPQLRLDAIEAVVVGGVLTLSGELIDPGTDDTFTIDVAWGDDTASSIALGRSPDGRQSFSLDHVFAAGAAAGVQIEITVRDDDGATRTYSRTVDVVEDTPEVTLSKPGAIDEYGIATIEATVATVADEGPFDLTVVWGDGAVQTLRFYPPAYGSDTITLSHRYLDDRATGADRYGVTVTAVGSDGATGTASTAVSVANVAPTLALQPIDPVGPDGVAVLTGTIVDPGREDRFTVVVDWGEVGSATRFETLTLGPNPNGSQPFSLRHVYDNPTGARYNVVATVVDDDGGTARATRVVEPENTAPILTVSLGDQSTNYENGIVWVTGTISDPDAAGLHTVSIDWGEGPYSNHSFELEVSPDSPRQFSVTHVYADDRPYQAPDFYEITVTTRDGAGASDTQKLGVQVVNLAPKFYHPLEFVNLKAGSGDNTIDAGGLIVLAGRYEDVGPLDTHNIQVSWGDGDVLWSAETPWRFDDLSDYGGRGSFQTGHFFEHGGIYTISVAVHDDDGGRALATRQIMVEGVGLRPSGVIDVIADDEAAVVNVFGDSVAQGRILGGTGATLPGVSPFITVTTDIPGAFSQSVASSMAHTLNFVGSSLADTIDIAPTARVAGTLRGFGGSDRLHGGILGDSIEGGIGADVIFGREGRDSISGGVGNDRIFGDYDAFKVGEFADILYGDDGNDTILGGGGNDTVNGGTGIDELAGGAESDAVIGGAGDDLIFGDAFVFLPPSAGDTRPEALATIADGSDWLVGEDGNDRLFGQNGNDTMLGGNGNDTFDGGNGFDVIRTGAGADIIVFREGDDADLVLDFGPGDRIDLRELDRSYISNVADVLARIGTEGANTVLYLGFGDRITLQNVDRAEITADDFLV